MNELFLVDPTAAFDFAAPERVVSLVPSTTGSLFDLGLGQALVGISDYCVPPADQVSGLVRVGGPKNIRVADILALQPDLIIANQEENDRDALEALAVAGARVWLTFPTSVHTAINDLWILANLFRSDLAMQQVDFLERAVEWAEMAAGSNESIPAMRYFCPIWEDDTEDNERWWMTFNAQTYPNDVLRILNGVNVFAGRERLYPLAADLGMTEAEDPSKRDQRYPRVGLMEIIAAQPEVILLPSEPYAYSEKDCAVFMRLFSETPAAQAGRIYAIDGTLITWHGTRLARALEELAEIFNR
jgi:ABC-type Fe3+-hydroxamate transport system substrate-binding protein